MKIEQSIDNGSGKIITNESVQEVVPIEVISEEDKQAKFEKKTQNKIDDDKKIDEIKKELIGENEPTKYKVTGGEDIISVARNTFRMANAFKGPIIAEFNDVELIINPGDNVEDVVRQFISKNYKETDWSETNQTPEGLLKKIMDRASVEKPLRYVSEVMDKIIDVAKKVSELSINQEGPVVTEFNDVELIINPGDTPEDVVRQFISKKYKGTDWSETNQTPEDLLKKWMK